ncbi:MAG: hypothetical protein M0Z89_01760, partial [Nitrospiraceae bacterium]|nr:hypothetical protein [Nitrospiraceae bacterium]
MKNEKQDILNTISSAVLAEHFSKLRIKIYPKWQEYFSQSAQRSQRKFKTLAFILRQKPRLLFLAYFASFA